MGIRQHLVRESQVNKPCQLSAVTAKWFFARQEGSRSVLLSGWIFATNAAKMNPMLIPLRYRTTPSPCVCDSDLWTCAGYLGQLFTHRVVLAS